MKFLLEFDGGEKVVAEGRACDGGYELLYRSGEQPYRLKVTKEKIVHECFGEYGLSLVFNGEGETVGRLRLGNSFADYPVKCTYMNVEIFPDGFRFEASFTDGEEERTVKAAADLITSAEGE